ncbi:hypothetical protein FIBSPDRAFT_849992 [Athelia psychrophila]|uniref:Uncharacterized protein n=1 Tax=Athelia psychrophila TaxID=1759441 RepID=A0A167U2N9_9AGAM|nr:hypothetical protein FIBSPDRAFT_879385 [Fibularhizoctonia sp. CBS 109695]KZP30964.1 hypothetical protein FIBSPDRAFT_849992 [Fibularhizoctonia sp. CBS 109695]
MIHIADDTSIHAAAAYVAKRLGGAALDVLVNNARRPAPHYERHAADGVMVHLNRIAISIVSSMYALYNRF